MRGWLSDLAEGRVTLHFDAHGDDQARVGPGARHQLFLVFKEALNNVLRHSGGSECNVELTLESGWITLAVSDNGTGFDNASVEPGNGIESMTRRAERLGGSLRVTSALGRGTRVELKAPATPEVEGRRRLLHK
jgi:signal transduction histidine kinase